MHPREFDFDSRGAMIKRDVTSLPRPHAREILSNHFENMVFWFSGGSLSVHISNLKFWNDPIAKLYHVSAIPATFILDEKGVPSPEKKR